MAKKKSHKSEIVERFADIKRLAQANGNNAYVIAASCEVIALLLAEQTKAINILAGEVRAGRK